MLQPAEHLLLAAAKSLEPLHKPCHEPVLFTSASYMSAVYVKLELAKISDFVQCIGKKGSILSLEQKSLLHLFLRGI